MTELAIPTCIADITPAWLTAALGTAPARVVDVCPERIGVGVGIMADEWRVTLTYDEPAPDQLASVVVKLVSSAEENRVLADEPPVGLEHGEEVGERVGGCADAPQFLAQQPEALEEHLPHQPPLVAEQLVHRRGGGVGLSGDAPRREPGGSLAREQLERHGEQSAAQLRGALLGPRH